MDSIPKFVAAVAGGVLIYTVLLAIMSNVLGSNGRDRLNAVASLLWWATIDIGLGCLSYALTVTAYRNWFPSEYLDELPLLDMIFDNSDVLAADLMALVLTGLVMAISHSLAFHTIAVMQAILEPRQGSAEKPAVGPDSEPAPQSPWVDAPWVGLLLATWAITMWSWESPVLVLRVASLMTDSVDMSTVAQYTGVGAIIGNSWLLRTLYRMWPLLILVTAYGFTRALLRVAAAVGGDTPVAGRGNRGLREVDEPAAQAGRGPGAAAVSTAEPLEPPAERPEASPANERRAAAPARPPVPEPPAVPEPLPAAQGGAGDGSIQNLIDQTEALRRQRDAALADRDARAHEQALDPLGQRNRVFGGAEDQDV